MTDYSATQKLDAREGRSPVAIIHGDRAGLIPDESARPLVDAFSGAPTKRGIKINRGANLVHLEMTRLALWRESIGLLRNDHVAAVPS